MARIANVSGQGKMSRLSLRNDMPLRDNNSSSVFGSNNNTADFLVDSGNDADSSDVFVATQNEEVVTLEENVFFEGNLDQNPSPSHGVQNVRSKKQTNCSLASSTEAEYRALASVTSEVFWILKILKDLQIEKLLPVSLHRDKKILKGVVRTVKVDSANHIADILTKRIGSFQHL
ncbi:hypothetical protein Tco_1111039 [Tanacetum coccineum]|uniref:Uncharacterized protein n=1 Tax=Tanacetum coccineum TaxID=301880 RepID=A0ABQ5IKG6_9ASTR